MATIVCDGILHFAIDPHFLKTETTRNSFFQNKAIMDAVLLKFFIVLEHVFAGFGGVCLIYFCVSAIVECCRERRYARLQSRRSKLIFFFAQSLS